MNVAPPDVLGLAALVFALGLRHGLDPDHLVAIDGLTRSTRSRWCGLFFSLGHGVVVTLIGVAVALAASDRQAPAWLEQTGAGISIGVLLVLGFATWRWCCARRTARRSRRWACAGAGWGCACVRPAIPW